MTDALFLRGQSLLQVLSFAYRLSDRTTPKDFFVEAEEQMRIWRREKRDIQRAATVLEAMLRPEEGQDNVCGNPVEIEDQRVEDLEAFGREHEPI
jgi:hypothetical protein